MAKAVVRFGKFVDDIAPVFVRDVERGLIEREWTERFESLSSRRRVKSRSYSVSLFDDAADNLLPGGGAFSSPDMAKAAIEQVFDLRTPRA